MSIKLNFPSIHAMTTAEWLQKITKYLKNNKNHKIPTHPEQKSYMVFLICPLKIFSIFFKSKNTITQAHFPLLLFFKLFTKRRNTLELGEEMGGTPFNKKDEIAC